MSFMPTSRPRIITRTCTGNCETKDTHSHQRHVDCGPGAPALAHALRPRRPLRRPSSTHASVKGRDRQPECWFKPDLPASFWKMGPRNSGGEGGIRTHGTVSRTLAFEASTLNHSVTSPRWFQLP